VEADPGRVRELQAARPTEAIHGEKQLIPGKCGERFGQLVELTGAALSEFLKDSGFNVGRLSHDPPA
jgi:hypothetical protein